MQSITHAIPKYCSAHCYQLYCAYNKENYHLLPACCHMNVC